MTAYIGLDIGYRNCGYGVTIEEPNGDLACACGNLTTRGIETMPAIYHELYGDMQQLVKEFQPIAIGIESVWFNHNKSTAFKVHGVGAIAMLIAQMHNLHFREYTPQQVKRAVTGSNTADKKSVQLATQRIYNLSTIPEPDHAADGLAVSYALRNELKLLERIKQ